MKKTLNLSMLLCTIILGSSLLPLLVSASDDPVDLARSDRDQPGDNQFEVMGSQASSSLLAAALDSNHLPETLALMKPSTDDPTIRKVIMKVNGNATQISFEKKIGFGFWQPVTMGGLVTVSNTSCANSQQIGYNIQFDMNGANAGKTQEYVASVNIITCASQQNQTEAAHGVQVNVERLLYRGNQYQPWIGSLIGDFMRPFGRALDQEMTTLRN